MATKGTIIIPTDHCRAETVIDEVAEEMADAFGGYSRYNGSGGWINSNDSLIEEDHVRLEATGTDRDRVEEFFRCVARNVKYDLKEESVYVEFQDVDVEFV